MEATFSYVWTQRMKSLTAFTALVIVAPTAAAAAAAAALSACNRKPARRYSRSRTPADKTRRCNLLFTCVTVAQRWPAIGLYSTVMYDVSPLICWQATAQPAPHCYSLAVLLLKEYQQGISAPDDKLT